MASESKSAYEKFFNISISDFYEYVASIMGDFGFVFHKNIKELPNKRRIELWKLKISESDQAIVWIEMTNSGSDVTKDVPAEVLRVMNDENLTKLFFFTNGGLLENEMETLEGKNHFIFTPSEIIESMEMIKNKEEKKEDTNKRKHIKVPSGFVLLKNYLEAHKKNIKSIVIRIDDIPLYSEKVSKKILKTLEASAQVKDINNIPQEERDNLKKIQYSLLPELTNISSLSLPDGLTDIKENLFDIVKNCVLYLGSLVEYESEDLLSKYMEAINKSIAEVAKSAEKVEIYKKNQMKGTFGQAFKLFIITFFILFLSFLLYRYTRG